MNAVIRGWCPSAYRPMKSGDGLIVRLKPKYSSITPEQLYVLAELSDAYGSGYIEVTSRANLQIRGVRECSFQRLLDCLIDEKLVDQNPAVESRRNFIVSPFRSESSFDHDRIADALSSHLVAPGIPELPSKFGFVIDVNPRIRHLANASGDIRFETATNGQLMVRAEGAEKGRIVSNEVEAVDTAMEMTRWFTTSNGIGTDGRGRMKRHLEAGSELPEALRGNAIPAEQGPVLKPGVTGKCYCVGSPFGLFSSKQLRIICDQSGPVIRVTHERLLMLDKGMLGFAFNREAGFILDEDDPIQCVYGCTGEAGCPQATVETRLLAKELSLMLDAQATLHVSGCSKGCAHPGPVDIAIVGNHGRFDLIVNGCASEKPRATGLSREEVLAIVGEIDAV
ncbi:MAG: precorrin-3B synthase [Rhizobiaceae bacterium]